MILPLLHAIVVAICLLVLLFPVLALYYRGPKPRYQRFLRRRTERHGYLIGISVVVQRYRFTCCFKNGQYTVAWGGGKGSH